MTTSHYPLGTDREEFERLHLQHRLWSDAAHSLWRRAGIAPGARVLDVGCGPGAATFDLAGLTTSSGRVVAIDASASFVAHITETAAARGFSQIQARSGDAHDLSALLAGESPFDLAYARWLLCFSKDPAAIVRGVANALAPGGRFCVHDYFNYETMTPAPRRKSYDVIVAATAKSWRDNGGDPDVVARLPRIFHECGLELVHLDVHQRLARPGETMWHWAYSWWKSYAPRLATMGYVKEEDVKALFSDLDAMKRETDFLVCPPVFELLAVKR